MESAPRLLDHLDHDDAEHFAQVRALLDVAEVPYEIDATLVRGLDYYARTVFEFTSDALGAQSGVGGGGRYDGLVEKIKGTKGGGETIESPPTQGPTTPGIGWAAGIERILLAGEPVSPVASPLDLFVALGDGAETRSAAFGVLGAARSAGLRAQMELAGRSLKGQLSLANGLAARYVAIVEGEATVLKDMQGGGQETLATDTVVHSVLRSLRDL
jgi:histidyl-tRNA synthetase